MSEYDTARAKYELARAAFIDVITARRNTHPAVERLDAAIVAFREARTDRNTTRLLLAAEDVVDALSEGHGDG